MQATYNGFTGGLVKLEKTGTTTLKMPCFGMPVERDMYDLSIYDSEKKVTYSFTGVKLEDVKFLCGEVTFGG